MEARIKHTAMKLWVWKTDVVRNILVGTYVYTYYYVIRDHKSVII